MGDAVTQISLDGFSVTGVDGSGNAWTVRDEQGWNDGAPIRRARVDKATQDGAWESTGYRSARTVVLSGVTVGPDRVSALAGSRQLRTLVGGTRAPLVWAEDDLTLSATVELDDTPRVRFVSPNIFEWQITLTAPDSLLYGSPTFAQTSLAGTAGGVGRVWPRVWPTDYGIPAGVTPGAITMSNVGTAGYWPTLRIDGPVPNPQVTLVETGDWVRFNGTVAAGQWLDFDLANRRVLLNGQVSVRAKVSASGGWLAVPPGGASVSWTADAADPAALLSVWGYQGAWT